MLGEWEGDTGRGAQGGEPLGTREPQAWEVSLEEGLGLKWEVRHTLKFPVNLAPNTSVCCSDEVSEKTPSHLRGSSEAGCLNCSGPRRTRASISFPRDPGA